MSLISFCNKKENHSEILQMLNNVFDGHFTKIIDETSDSYFVYDAKTDDVCEFKKSTLKN